MDTWLIVVMTIVVIIISVSLITLLIIGIRKFIKRKPKTPTVPSGHYSKSEDDMLSMARLAMVFSFLAYGVAALIISANFGWQYILAFVFGALVYIPVVCLLYYCIKVFADMSRNTRSTAEDLQEIRKTLNRDSKPEAAEEAAQQEQANT